METVLSSHTSVSLEALKTGSEAEVVGGGLISNAGDHPHGVDCKEEGHDSSDEEVEVEEVKDELENLQADTLYHEFRLDVSLNR